jgi:hypothetical protein
MKKGTRVKMSEDLKAALRSNGCDDHVREFGNCIGIVEGPVDYGSSQGPEVDVRWQPGSLRYAYHPDQLVKI